MPEIVPATSPLARPTASRDFFSLSESSIADVRGRTTMIAKARWLLLLFTATYTICAATFFSYSSLGLPMSSLQWLLIGLSFTAIFSYNAIYHFYYESIHRLKFVDHFQVLLDMLFVTILAYCSGSAASWLWALYLLVTLEASILLQRQRDVWCLGAVGSLLYGGLLIFGYWEIFPPLPMPFVAPELHTEPVYLLLNWLWVCLLNTTVAVTGATLMQVIRKERSALVATEAQRRTFLDSAHDLIFCCDPAGKFQYVNPAWLKTLDYSLAELEELTLLEMLSGEHRSRCQVGFRRVLRGEQVTSIEGSLLAKNGIKVTVEGSFTCTFKQGQPDAVWGICRDITARKEAQEQLHYMAHHDMLTDLPNRLTFVDRLIQAKAMAKRSKHMLAVLFLDLDRFKVINDSLGHDTGDQVLQEIANRLVSCIREIDTAARFGGDEFAILLINPKSRDDVQRVASKILQKLAQPLLLDDNELFITTSIGVAIYPADGDDEEELIKRADTAMYHSKALGRNTFQFYNSEMNLNAERRMILENSLRRALENEEFYILYQPKVNLQTGQVTALEALLRWEHPKLGAIPPGDFISLAEESGLIVPLGEWVLRKACLQNLAWQRQGLPPVRMAVNLSGFQLERKDFISRISTILEETGLEGKYLELEITETVIMQNPDFAVKVLSQLKEMGIHISIDDFGTGYSSLAHLKRFSVNTLKIDKSFVTEVEKNSTDAAITSAIIAMGKSLDLSVIAEGVETEGQRAFLQSERCHEMQGFLFSKPVPAAAIETILQTGKAPLQEDMVASGRCG